MKKNSSVKLDPYIEEIAEGIANDIADLVGQATKMDVVLAVARKVNEVQAMLEKVMHPKQAQSATKEWVEQVLEKKANCTYQNIRKWVQIENWRASDSRAEAVLVSKNVHVAYQMASFFTSMTDHESVRVKAAFNLAAEMPMTDRQLEKFFNLYKRDTVLFDWLATHVRSHEVLSAFLKKASKKGAIPDDLRKGLLTWSFDGTPLSVADIERVDREAHQQVATEVVKDLKVAISGVDEDDEPEVVRANQSCFSCAYGQFSSLPGMSQQAKVGRCNHHTRRQNADLNLYGGIDPGVHCGQWKLTDRLQSKPKKDDLEIEETTSKEDEQDYVAPVTRNKLKTTRANPQAYFKASCERLTFSSMQGWDAKSTKFNRLDLVAACALYGVPVEINELSKISEDDLRERIGNHLCEFLPSEG